MSAPHTSRHYASTAVPPLPPKLRRQPKLCDVGAGKTYADEASLLSDLAAWNVDAAERALLIKARRQAKERLREQRRDRSGRQRDSEQETDSQRRVRRRRSSSKQWYAHADREATRRLAAGKRRTGVRVLALPAHSVRSLSLPAQA